MRTVRRLWILGFVMVAAVFTLPQQLIGCLEIATANPAATILGVLASRPTAPDLAKAIERCGQVGVQRDDCNPRVGWVLLTYSRIGPSERRLVLHALTILENSSSLLVREEAAGFLGCIESGLGCDRTAKEPHLRLVDWYRSIGVRRADGPPTSAEIGISETAFDGRLLLYLDELLPRGFQARIREGFGALTAEGCQDFLGGRAMEVCRDLGVFRGKLGCMRLLIDEIDSGTPDAALVSLVTEMDNATYQRIEDFLTRIDCCGCHAYQLSSLLQGWRMRCPSELEAWRDVETTFRPDVGYLLMTPTTPAPSTPTVPPQR